MPSNNTMKQYLRLTVRFGLTVAVVWALAMAQFHTADEASVVRLTLYSILLLASGVWSLLIAFRPRLFGFLLRAEKAEDRLEPLHLFIAPFVFIFSFMLLCHQLHLFDQSLFVVTEGVVALSDATEWTMFALDHTIRAVCLDTFETFYVHIATIAYRDLFWLCALIFAFKTTLTVFFWRIVFRIYRNWSDEPNPSTACAV